MGEVRRHISETVVDRICDECGKGRMRPTATILTSYPPQFVHECTHCGAMDIYDVRYPYREMD